MYKRIWQYSSYCSHTIRPLSEFSPQAQAKYKSHWEDRKEIIKTLLKENAHINHANNDGDTALIEAIKNHDIDIAQSLLQTPGINVNHANNDGDTALVTDFGF